MEGEDDGPLFAIVATPLFREIDLKAVSDSVQLDAAIEEAGLLRRFRAGRLRFRMGADRSNHGGRIRAGWRSDSPRDDEANNRRSKRTKHR
jgi:hypothetical protein